MSFQAMAWAVKQPLKCQEKMVLLMLANYADDRAMCWPSVARIAADGGLSASHVRKCFASLEKLGVLRRDMQMRSYGQTTNAYYLNLDVTIRIADSPPL